MVSTKINYITFKRIFFTFENIRLIELKLFFYGIIMVETRLCKSIIEYPKFCSIIRYLLTYLFFFIFNIQKLHVN